MWLSITGQIKAGGYIIVYSFSDVILFSITLLHTHLSQEYYSHAHILYMHRVGLPWFELDFKF